MDGPLPPHIRQQLPAEMNAVLHSQGKVKHITYLDICAILADSKYSYIHIHILLLQYLFRSLDLNMERKNEANKETYNEKFYMAIKVL